MGRFSPALHFLCFISIKASASQKKREEGRREGKGCALVILMGSLSPRLLQQSFLCSWPGREIICIMLPLLGCINARHQEICFEGHFPGLGQALAFVHPLCETGTGCALSQTPGL